MRSLRIVFARRASATIPTTTTTTSNRQLLVRPRHHHHHPSTITHTHTHTLVRQQSTKAAGAAVAAAVGARGGAEGGGEGPRHITRAGVRPKGPSFIPRRGDNGRGWYELYKEEGPEGFQKYRPPTPFDWSLKADTHTHTRTKAYLNVSIDKEEAGKIVIELADDLLPLTTKNFIMLCQGTDIYTHTQSEGEKRGYKGTTFHRVVKGAGIVGGDLSSNTQTLTRTHTTQKSKGGGNHSALGSRFFHDEGFFIPHTGPGLVSMVSAGVHRNASYFHISTEACPHLNGRSVVFGRVIEGMNVVEKIASTYSIRGKPVAAVKIKDAGVL